MENIKLYKIQKGFKTNKNQLLFYIKYENTNKFYSYVRNNVGKKTINLRLEIMTHLL